MVRTKGSGWGGGVILYQMCPLCEKKKAYYDRIDYCGFHSFKCSSCKRFFNSDKLIRLKYVSQLKKQI